MLKMRKRVAPVSIIPVDTSVLIFDEPTAGLDSGEIDLFTGVLNAFQRKGKTVVIISHDMNFDAENFRG